MTEDNKSEVQSADANAKSLSIKPKETKERAKPLTKIIIRGLPPSMEGHAFLEQLSPMPEYDYFYFTKPDPTLGVCGYSRAYINFIQVEDIFIFKDKFDGYIFLDEKGVEYPGIVEYAPFQRVPKKRKKKDPKCGTIESDPVYLEFIESLKEADNESKEPKLEFSYLPPDEDKQSPQTTPLLDFLANRRAEKAKVREEKRLRDAERRKPKTVDKRGKDTPAKEENQEGDVKKIKPRDGDKEPTKKEYTPKHATGFAKDIKPFGKPGVGTKPFKDQRVKEVGKKEPFKGKDADLRKERREKVARDFPKERGKEVKKYSDTRKEREKSKIGNKGDVKEDIEKFVGIPVTQLPSMNIEDLSRVIDEMDKKRNDSGDAVFTTDSLNEIISKNANTEGKCTIKPFKKPFESLNHENNIGEEDDDDAEIVSKKSDYRRNSLESGEIIEKEESLLRRHKSLEDKKSKSEERDYEKEDDTSKNNDSSDPRVERRIRNKDRPTLAIYQPGKGRFSKSRVTKDKYEKDSIEAKEDSG